MTAAQNLLWLWGVQHGRLLTGSFQAPSPHHLLSWAFISLGNALPLYSLHLFPGSLPEGSVIGSHTSFWACNFLLVINQLLHTYFPCSLFLSINSPKSQEHLRTAPILVWKSIWKLVVGFAQTSILLRRSVPIDWPNQGSGGTGRGGSWPGECPHFKSFTISSWHARSLVPVFFS